MDLSSGARSISRFRAESPSAHCSFLSSPRILSRLLLSISSTFPSNKQACTPEPLASLPSWPSAPRQWLPCQPVARSTIPLVRRTKIAQLRSRKPSSLHGMATINTPSLTTSCILNRTVSLTRGSCSSASPGKEPNIDML